MQQGKVNNGGQNNYTTQVDQGLTVVKGKHEFKMGWDLRREETYGYDLAGTNGNYMFARNETAYPVRPELPVTRSRVSFSASRTPPLPKRLPSSFP